MSLPRNVKFQLGLALLFLFLGAANIIFGSYKSDDYRELLSKAEENLASGQLKSDAAAFKGPGEGELSESTDIASDSNNPNQPLPEYIPQLKARYDFYAFVVVGGKWILALAGFFLLLALVSLKENGVTDPR